MAAKKKVEEEKTENLTIDSFLASEAASALKKRFGDSILTKASEDKSLEIKRLSTGIFVMDYALGGGWPAGRINIGYGQKSSTKTTTFLRTIAEAQHTCSNCYTQIEEDTGFCQCTDFKAMKTAYVDVEGAWDPKWAATIGVDASNILYSRPDYGEQAVDIVDMLLRSGDIDIIVVDSLAALLPVKEQEGFADADPMMLQARLINKLIRKCVSGQSALKNEAGKLCTIFLANQIRTKPVMFGNPEVTPGGQAPGFAASVEVKYISAKYETEESNSNKPKSVDVEFRVEKNKTGFPKMQSGFTMVLRETEYKRVGEIYDEEVIVNLAQRVGMITGAGASWETMGQKFNSKSLIQKELLTNPAFSQSFRKALMPRLLAA